jgi:enamine deaminase RidA (YjgF/YER057c/UK114 family)
MVEAHNSIPGLLDPSGPFSHVTVGAGTRIVSVAGQVALDEDGHVVGEGDARAQAAQCLHNVDVALRYVGASVADVVNVTVFLTDVGDRAAVADMRRAYFGTHAPAATLVEVAGLAIPGCVVEIQVTAVL